MTKIRPHPNFSLGYRVLFPIGALAQAINHFGFIWDSNFVVGGCAVAKMLTGPLLRAAGSRHHTVDDTRAIHTGNNSAFLIVPEGGPSWWLREDFHHPADWVTVVSHIKSGGFADLICPPAMTILPSRMSY